MSQTVVPSSAARNRSDVPRAAGVQQRGVLIQANHPAESVTVKAHIVGYLAQLGLCEFVEEISDECGAVGFQLQRASLDALVPDGDTSQICTKLNLNTRLNDGDLEREIVIAMLACPVVFHFPSDAEFLSAVRIRKYIVQAARSTSLSFATDEAERPPEHWDYDEDRGFFVRTGKSLIDALVTATQPGESGKRYTFSCRRAGEYIVLLAVARETQVTHPELFSALQRQSEMRAIKGREFERIFHRQIGSKESPLPVKFFMPGDRTWFRNPDPISCEITGYEGSWTFYLGNGIFADFWRPNQIYSLTTKCLSIYHWRNATFRDANNELQIDESRVEAHVARSLQDPLEMTAILEGMCQLQWPLDQIGGGIVEPHREYVKQVAKGTSDLNLPDIAVSI